MRACTFFSAVITQSRKEEALFVSARISHFLMQKLYRKKLLHGSLETEEKVKWWLLELESSVWKCAADNNVMMMTNMRKMITFKWEAITIKSDLKIWSSSLLLPLFFLRVSSNNFSLCFFVRVNSTEKEMWKSTFSLSVFNLACTK